MRDKVFNRGLALALASTAIGALTTTSAVAQSANSNAAGQIDEVVITAQRRAERLQDVPISVQVMGAEERVEQNVNTLIDLQETVPSVHVAKSGRGNLLFIRGIGSGGNSSFDQSVGIFIDEIYHGRSRTSISTFLDVERVEVLKGPQTTYFGNSAIAGAFNIVTARPTPEFKGWARALYGEDGQYAVEAAGGGPVTEDLSVRMAAGVNGLGGWIDNLNTGKKAPNYDNLAGRITFAYKPSENFDATFKVEGSSNTNHSGHVLQIDKCPPDAPLTPGAFCATALSQGAPVNADKNQISTNAGQKQEIDTLDSALIVNYRFANHTLTSVTGYYEYNFKFNLDADATPLPLIHTQQPERYNQISQEFRLASPTDQPIEYLLGVYYHKGELHADALQSFFFQTPTIAGAIPALAPYLPLGQLISFAQEEESMSVFGTLSWNVTDQLKVTAGLRGSRVKKDFDWRLLYATANALYGAYTPLPASVAALPGALGLGRPGSVSGSRSDDAWMPSARVQYHVNSDVMVYASYARGFKGGGFNSAYSAPAGINLAEIGYNPEFADAYEIGLKSEWFNRRFMLNMAFFRSEYTDRQVVVNQLTAAGTFSGIVRNAAESYSQGVELETRWNVTPDFKITGALTYLDTKYKDYKNVSLTVDQTRAFAACRAANAANLAFCEPLRFQDLSGRRTQFAPKFSGSISAEYAAHLPGDYTLTTNLTASGSSKYAFSDTLDPRQDQRSYVRLDGRLTLEFPGESLAIDLLAQNLADKDILNMVTGYPNAAGSLLVERQQPRNFALQVRYEW